jgi:hypothetical protein
MGKVYAAIDDRIEAFLRAQRLFFVATAPLSRTGHVNVSPKGLDSFAILDRETVAYLDLGGSGIETIAHLRENGRIVLMFCAFEGPPKIVRLHGRGEVVEVGEPGFEALAAHFPMYPHARAVIRVRCTRISDSCGYGVPLFEFAGQRSQLLEWSDRKGEAGIRQYREEHNRRSLDGLPGLRAV